MALQWYFSRFSYDRYIAVRQAIRSATTPEAFTDLTRKPEVQAIADSLAAGEVPPETARAAFIQTICCLGDPLLLERGLPRFTADISRMPLGEDVAELLSDACAGGKNIEGWMIPSSGLISFFKPEETRQLLAAYTPLVNRSVLRRKGLIKEVSRFFVQVFDREPPTEDLLVPLRALLAEAVQRDEGIAILVV